MIINQSPSILKTYFWIPFQLFCRYLSDSNDGNAFGMVTMYTYLLLCRVSIINYTFSMHRVWFINPFSFIHSILTNVMKMFEQDKWLLTTICLSPDSVFLKISCPFWGMRTAVLSSELISQLSAMEVRINEECT